MRFNLPTQSNRTLSVEQMAVAPGSQILKGFISYDVPHAFRGDLPTQARLNLSLSDALKVAARGKTIREMVDVLSGFRERVSARAGSHEILDRTREVERQIVKGGDAGLAGFALGARAYAIDASYVDTVRRPSRVALMGRGSAGLKGDEVRHKLEDGFARIREDIVMFALTTGDVADAKAIVAGDAGGSAERPGGLSSSRMAFFIAASRTALVGKGGEGGASVLEQLGAADREVKFSVSGLQRLADRALHPDEWLTNLGKVQDESIARTRSRIRARGTEMGVGR